MQLLELDDKEQLKLLHDIVLEYRDSLLQDTETEDETTNILNLIRDALEIDSSK